MTKQKLIELLAPGGDVDSIKAAIAAGANAVYCGVNKFNARNRASNISFDDLNGILRLAHKNECKVFLTLNIIITEPEIPDLLRLLNRLINTSIDGIIVQDLGLFYLLSNYFQGLNIHASTQLTSHNEGQLKFLARLNASRVNLSRELNLDEITSLSRVAHEYNMLSEVFVHGSYCISFSGLCYMSSVQGGNSGNRGRCSQPCRDRYLETPAGSQFPLNLKDNSAWSNLKEISEADVDSIKIEGRIKKFHYVHSVVDSYRTQLQQLYLGNELHNNDVSLRKTFNRNFSNGFLKGKISQDMFIDNPRDQSATDLPEFAGVKSLVKKIINNLSIGKAPLKIQVSGKVNSPLIIDVKSDGSSMEFSSKKNLAEGGNWFIEKKELLKRFKAFNDTEYFIEELNLDNLQPGLQIPFSELTSLKNNILFYLRDSRESHDPVALPALSRTEPTVGSPALSVLISSKKDLHFCEASKANIFFQLPDSLSDKQSTYIETFKGNRKIIPWFPAVLIGEDFRDAVTLLSELRPMQIVTDNTGIAFEAQRLGISWIAGPRLNLVNSYSLLTLKGNFSCSGAFISNELNRQQINGIKKPKDFDLYYSIYHPIELMISRQCFFQQVTGCEKQHVDQECIRSCRKSATITNLKKEKLFIDKKAGNYNRIYNEQNFLNTDIITDIPDMFTGFLIDLRDIKSETTLSVDKADLIKLFDMLIKGIPGSAEQLKQDIAPVSYSQYVTGI